MKLPEIKGFIDLSLVDWDDRVSAVIFLPYCNFRCPFCYNPTLVLDPTNMQTVAFTEISRYLTRNRVWLDGVTITGGEPTVHDELSALCKSVKELDLEIKLDTNGTNPKAVQELIDQELVDYIAMDIKAPLTVEKYSKASGFPIGALLREAEKTIEFLMGSSLDYEFRTTIVPTIHNKNDIKLICTRIKGCKRFVLQSFKGDVETINPRMRHVRPLSESERQEILASALEIEPSTRLR